MTAEIVNLRLARKRKARDRVEAKAASNRLSFGRSKTERLETQARAAREQAMLDGHRLDSALPAGTANTPRDDG